MALVLFDIFLLVLLPLLLTVSGFASGAETSLFNLTRHQVLQLKRSGTLAGAATATLLANPRSLLITLLTVNMVVNVGYFAIATVFLVRLQHEYAWAAAILSPLPLIAMIMCGEVLPKLLAVRLGARGARLVALPLLLIHRVMGPVRVILEAVVVTPIARLISPGKPEELTPDELHSLLELSQAKGVIDADEERILQQVLSLSQMRVRDIMKPRVDLVAHDLRDDPEVLVDMIRLTDVRKAPAYWRDLDHIVGVLDSREVLLNRPRTSAQARALVRPIMFVPQTQRLDRMLEDFRRTSTALAIAVDEHGGTAGLVTLEDLVEQVVGQIAGGYEMEDSPILEEVGTGMWEAPAALSIHEWTSVFQQSGEAQPQGISTLGGLVMARLGRPPKVGDRTTIGNVSIEVLAMKRLRPERLLVKLNQQETLDKTGGTS